MTEKDSQPDISRHETEYQLQQNDVDDITGLIAVVGRELTTIDKLAAGGMKKTTKLSQQKIFNKKPTTKQPSPVQTQQSDTIDNKLEKLKNDIVNKQPVQKQPPLEPVRNKTQSIDVEQINLMRVGIKNIEKKVDNLTNIFENILTKLTTNTKRVTLTINDSKD